MSADEPRLRGKPHSGWAWAGYLLIGTELVLLTLWSGLDGRGQDPVKTAILLWAIIGIPVSIVVAFLMVRRASRTDIPTSPTPNRRRFRFSLWTLFAAVTVTAFLLYPLSWIQQRHAILARGRGSEFNWDEGGFAPILLAMFCEPGYYSVVVRFYDDNAGGPLTPDQQREVDRARRLFPESIHVRGVVFSPAMDPGH